MIQPKEIKILGIEDFSSTIRSLISKDVFFHSDEYQIAYDCLKLINFSNLQETKESIENHSLEVIKSLTSLSSLQEKPVNSFLLLTLNINTLPTKHKTYLEKITKEDLLKIDELIKHYESTDFIKNHNTNRNIPRNHNENTIFVFYQRTLKKQKEIIDYLLYKLDDRAIEKSKAKISTGFKRSELAELEFKFEIHNDFPYKDLILKEKDWIYEIDFQKLDYRKINPMRNKTFSLKIKSDFSQGYTEELKKEIEHKIRPEIYLESILKKVKTLPVINKREEIFKELKELYRGEKWYGFYALALPQIEGIFSEMSLILNPNKVQLGSLSDKVQRIRPYYDNRDYYFDYYEFYLPNQRNKFSHSGKDKQIEVKCYFLLLDLVSILDIVEELNSPLIELNKIIQQEIYYFEDIGKFSRFLFLLTEIDLAKQSDLIGINPQSFMEEIFLNKIDIKSFFSNLQRDFDIACKVFNERFFMLSKIYFKKGINIFSSSNEQISNQIDNIGKVMSDSGISIVLREELKLLIDINYFVSKFQKRFNSTDKKILLVITDFSKKNKNELDKIQIINAKLKIELPEDFLISRDKWLHISK